VTAKTLLGLGGFHWLALVTALLALVIVAEAWLGHYRSGFPLRAQYVPLLIGGLLILTCVAAVVFPGERWVHVGLRAAGWLAIPVGIIGVGYHHWYGIIEKAGAYRWLLHYLMYSAPPLAPLALTAVGILALVAERGLAGGTTLGGIDLPRVLHATAALALIGALLEAAILHYRGAFNTPFMYAPFVAPPLAVAAIGWLAIAPGPAATGTARVLLWLTFLTGFVGLGMHLRGLDRMMGGLRVWRMNLLQGPPPTAPAVFAGFAIVELLAIDLVSAR
jgi:hypothetical protein